MIRTKNPAARWSLLALLALCGAAPLARAQAPAAATPSGDEVLRKVDKQANAFSDASFTFVMKVYDPGQVREVQFMTLQKGTQKRLVRFLAPGDIKGMGFLMESADTMYALLPAFGNRVRRLGTHQQRSQSFMGSDVLTDDMSAVEFNTAYAATVAGNDGDAVVLNLTLRPGQQSDFPKLKLWVDPKLSTLRKIEYYDNSGKKLRTQERTDFRKDDKSDYWAPFKMTFIDHRRNDHKTELILTQRTLNSGLADGEFTVRALQRN